jgi:Mpv17 / PMP22 family
LATLFIHLSLVLILFAHCHNIYILYLNPRMRMQYTPTKFQVLVSNCVALVWNAYLSYTTSSSSSRQQTKNAPTTTDDDNDATILHHEPIVPV